MVSTEFRLIRDPEGANEIEENLIDIDPAIKAFNRFARQAVAQIDDPDGDRFGAYPINMPVLIQAKRNIDEEFDDILGGFVSNPQTDDEQLELEILSHDHWLRKRQPVVSYEEETLFEILKHLIEVFTPLHWNPDRIEIENNRTITRTWRGEILDEIIDEISSMSANEEFGGTDDMEFFFRQRDTLASPREFTDRTDYYDASFEEDSKQEVNRVELHYGEGDDRAAVAVQDRSSQIELREELNAPRPVVIEVKKEHPEIESRTNAERKARKYLEGMESIRVGEIVTWEGFNLEPGMITPLDIEEQGVDGDWRIAEITYQYNSDRTSLILAENREGVTDVLVEQSREIRRQDAKNIDEDTVIDENLDTDSGGEFEIEEPNGIVFESEGTEGTSRWHPGIGRDAPGIGLEAVLWRFGTGRFEFGVNRGTYGIERDRFGTAIIPGRPQEEPGGMGISVGTDWPSSEIRSARITRGWLNAIRAAWGDDPAIDEFLIVVGTGEGSVSISNEAMGEEFHAGDLAIEQSEEIVSMDEYLPTFPKRGEITELGIVDADEGTLLARLRIDDPVPVTSNARGRFRLEIIANDDESREADLLSAGRETLANILSGGSETIEEVAFGIGQSDDPDPSELDEEVERVSVDEFDNRSTGIVEIISSLDEDQAEGKTITEMGQINASGDLVTYLTFNELPVGEDVMITANDRFRVKNA